MSEVLNASESHSTQYLYTTLKKDHELFRNSSEMNIFAQSSILIGSWFTLCFQRQSSTQRKHLSTLNMTHQKTRVDAILDIVMDIYVIFVVDCVTLAVYQHHFKESGAVMLQRNLSRPFSCN